jgi:Ras family
LPIFKVLYAEYHTHQQGGMLRRSQVFGGGEGSLPRERLAALYREYAQPHRYPHTPEVAVWVLGESCVGRTSLVMRMCYNVVLEVRPHDDPIPSDSYRKRMTVNHTAVLADILDDDPGALVGRKPRAFLLGCALNDHASFDRLPHLLSFARSLFQVPWVPVVLVGTKADLTEERAVSHQELSALAHRWSCPFFEYSIHDPAAGLEPLIALCAAQLSFWALLEQLSSDHSAFGTHRKPKCVVQ